MKCLVTGADGFIGSHLAEHLVRAGHDVRAMVQYDARNSEGWLEALAPDVRGAMEVLAGDVRDADCVDAAVAGRDTVLHLAALIGIPYSYQAPASYIDVNVTGTLNMVNAARRHGVRRFVQTSTSEVYGTARFVPITEEHPLGAQSPYAASKIGADQMALSFHAAFDLPVVVARPFNTYGPRQSARAVIPTVIAQISAGERRLRLGALSPTRDFSFVADTVAGLATLAASDAGLGEVVNLRSNFEISIGDTVALIADVMGAEVETETDEFRVRPESSEVERLWADNAKAARIFGWRPEFAGRRGFRRGLASTAAWFTDPVNLARYKPAAYNV